MTLFSDFNSIFHSSVFPKSHKELLRLEQNNFYFPTMTAGAEELLPSLSTK